MKQTSRLRHLAMPTDRFQYAELLRSALSPPSLNSHTFQNVLKERERQLSAIIQAFDGFVYVCAKDFRLEFMNARLIQRTGFDGTGQLCHKVLHNQEKVCPWCRSLKTSALPQPPAMARGTPLMVWWSWAQAWATACTPAG